MTQTKLPQQQALNRFLAATERLPVRATGDTARLLFALDATASRQPTWDTACSLQAAMLDSIGQAQALKLRLCYYRGFDEFRATPWLSDSQALRRAMSAVSCLGGHTQIARLLRFVRKAALEQPVQAAVFIGDALEEDPDTVCQLAGELGVQGVPLFIFQEGDEPTVTQTFQQMARLSRGAWARFDHHSADALRQLLEAATRFAQGGVDALRQLNNPSASTLLEQMHANGGSRR